MNERQFFNGIRSAGVHLRGAIMNEFLHENKITTRKVEIYHVYSYMNARIWYHITGDRIDFSTRDPFSENKDWTWRAEATALEPLRKDSNKKANLIPKEIYFMATYRGQKHVWVYNPAEQALLGEEPCLTKVEQLNNK